MRIGRRGIAAVEFALIAPVLTLLAVGVYDVVTATTTGWHMTLAARSVGQIAVTTAANPDLSNSLSATEAYTASTAAYPVMPQFATAAVADFGVVLSSVVFTPKVAGCTSGCEYTAAVAWSKTLVGGAAARACGALTSVSNNASPSRSTLPADAFGAAPLLVVDVAYNFRPLFAAFITAAIPMMRSAYLSPRTGSNAQWVRYTDSKTPKPMCPGFT